MKHIGIVGSRRRNSWDDLRLVEIEFTQIWEPGDIIVSGGAIKGADKFAEMLAFKYGSPGYTSLFAHEHSLYFPDNLILFEPQWEDESGKYKRWAGFERNTDIAKLADVLIACPHPDRTGGTEDTINKFEKFHPGEKAILV